MKDRFVLTRGMLLLIIIVLIIIIGSIIGISISKSNSVERYKEFEEELESNAENYLNIKNLELEEGEERKVTLSSLKKQGLVTNKLAEKCTGYVIISNEINIENDQYELIYNSYIKCKNKYTTNNYSQY